MTYERMSSHEKSKRPGRLVTELVQPNPALFSLNANLRKHNSDMVKPAMVGIAEPPRRQSNPIKSGQTMKQNSLERRNASSRVSGKSMVRFLLQPSTIWEKL